MAKTRVRVDIHLFGKSGRPVTTYKSARSFYIGVKSLNFWFKGTFTYNQGDSSKAEKLDSYSYELLEQLTKLKKLAEPKQPKPKKQPKLRLRLKEYDKPEAMISKKDKKIYTYRFLEAQLFPRLKIDHKNYQAQISTLFNLYWPSILSFWKRNKKSSLNRYLFRLMIGIDYKDSVKLSKQGWGAERGLDIATESELSMFLRDNLKAICYEPSSGREKTFLSYVHGASISEAIYRGFSLEVITSEQDL